MNSDIGTALYTGTTDTIVPIQNNTLRTTL